MKKFNLRERLVGNERILEELESTFNSDSLPRACLFYGPKGVGKARAAELLIKAYFCEDDEAPCDKCRNCQRFESRNYPEFHRVNGKDGINAIRKIQSKVRLQPFEGGHRFILIDDFNLMSEPGIHAILKILEEDQGYAEVNTFLLVCHDIDAVPDTIESRCFLFCFMQLSEEVMSGLARGWELEFPGIGKLLRVSRGRPGILRAYAKSGKIDLLEQFDKFRYQIAESRHPIQFIDWAEALGPNDFTFILDAFAVRWTPSPEDFGFFQELERMRVYARSREQVGYVDRTVLIDSLLSICERSGQWQKT